MRKEYGKALRAEFSSIMKQELPGFEETKVKSIYFWSGDRAFCRKVTDRLHCWIVLSPSKKDYDEFTVLIGWSKLGRYPELSMIPCAQMPTPDHEEFANQEYLTRLPSLWTNQDQWWVVKEFQAPLTMEELAASLEPVPAAKANQAVIPLVRDAVAKLKEFGLPYLEKLARHVQGG